MQRRRLPQYPLYLFAVPLIQLGTRDNAQVFVSRRNGEGIDRFLKRAQYDAPVPEDEAALRRGRVLINEKELIRTVRHNRVDENHAEAQRKP